MSELCKFIVGGSIGVVVAGVLAFGAMREQAAELSDKQRHLVEKLQNDLAEAAKRAREREKPSR